MVKVVHPPSVEATQIPPANDHTSWPLESLEANEGACLETLLRRRNGDQQITRLAESDHVILGTNHFAKRLDQGCDPGTSGCFVEPDGA
jgi:hypothetical protein